MISEIFTIIKKDFYQLLHSKLSSLVIVIGPLLILLVAGLALSGATLKEINLALYSSQIDNAFEDSLITKFEEKGIFVTMTDTLDDCKQLVKEGTANICVEIVPRESSLSQYDARFGNQLLFYVDYSKIRMVWLVINIIRNIVAQENLVISTQILTQITDNLQIISQQVGEKRILLDKSIAEGEIIRNDIEKYDSSIDAAISFTDQIKKNDLRDLQSSINTQRTELDNFYAFATPLLTNQSKVQLDSYYFKTSSALRVLDTQIDDLVVVSNQLLDAINELGGAGDLKTARQELKIKLNSNLNKLKELRKTMDSIDQQIGQFKTVRMEEVLNPIPIIIDSIVEGQSMPSSEVPGSYLDYLLPALLLLIIIFVAPLLSTTLVMKERKSRASFRNSILPVPRVTFIIATYITSLLLIMVQMSVLLTLALFFFKVDIFQNLGLLLLILFLIITLFSFIGIGFGFLFNSQETAILGSVSSSILFLVLSEFVIPVETAPKIFDKIIGLNPFVLSEGILRKLLIFNLPFETVIVDMIILSVYLVILITLVSIIIWLSKKEL